MLDRRMTLLWASNASMSSALCGAIAAAEEYRFFATQWGRECWAGASAGQVWLAASVRACVQARA